MTKLEFKNKLNALEFVYQSEDTYTVKDVYCIFREIDKLVDEIDMVDSLSKKSIKKILELADESPVQDIEGKVKYIKTNY